MTRPVSAAKLTKRLEALNARHGKLEEKLLNRTETTARSITCADEINALKKRKYQVKLSIQTVEHLLADTRTTADTVEVAPDDAAVDLLTGILAHAAETRPDDTILIRAEPQAHVLQSAA